MEQTDKRPWKKRVLTMSELADLYNYLGKTEIKRGFITKAINDPNKAQKITRQEAIDNYGLPEECLDKEWKDACFRTIDEVFYRESYH